MSVDRLPELTVDRLARRDPRRCVHCGRTDGLTVQHRANRGHGGSRSAESPANGILLCAVVNGLLEADPGWAKYARRAGWKVSRYADPATVPVWDAVDRVWLLLDHEGGRCLA